MVNKQSANIINALLGCMYLYLAWQFISKLFEGEEAEKEKDKNENVDDGA